MFRKIRPAAYFHPLSRRTHQAEAFAALEQRRIDTEANKAINVFYVTRGGAKLDPATQQAIGAALWQASASPEHLNAYGGRGPVLGAPTGREAATVTRYVLPSTIH